METGSRTNSQGEQQPLPLSLNTQPGGLATAHQESLAELEVEFWAPKSLCQSQHSTLRTPARWTQQIQSCSMLFTAVTPFCSREIT